MKTKVIVLAKTVAVVICGVGLLATTLAVTARVRADSLAERNGHIHHVQHVLLISVDGLHQSDLAWYVQNHPESTLAALTTQGVDYSNASTPFPSDSFPGMVGPATGGNPATTGIYYDDTWNHRVFPAGAVNC